MTLLMRDQENQKIGEVRGQEKMIVNALNTTRSVKQTSFILQVSEQEVRKVAVSKKISVND